MSKIARCNSTISSKTQHASDRDGDHGRAAVLDATVFPDGAQPGDLVLVSPPFAKVLQPELWRSHCHFCFATEPTTLSRCGRCRAVYYCSRACQQSDWKPDHRVECKQLEQLLSLRLRSAQIANLLLLGRVMRRLDTEAAATVASTAAASTDAVTPMDLVWHAAQLDHESLLLATLAQKLTLVDASLPVHEFQTMLSRFASNNFSICDDLLLEVGAGCYPLGAMVNHSCEPNCAVTFTAGDQRAEFRAMRSIAPDEEITQSYVDIALPRRERQQRLAQKYAFECACTRCALPAADPASRDAMLDADIDGVPESQWSGEREQEVAQARAMLNQASSESEFTALLQQALEALQRVLHEENTTMLQTYSALFSAEMERRSVAAAVPFGERMLAFYERVYPAKHPLVGLHLFTLGDLHLQLQQQQQQREPRCDIRRAHEYLTRAKAILQITHGKRHRFVELLEERLSAIQQLTRDSQ